MAPMHLLNIYNTFNNASYDYNLRNNIMQLIYSRTESFRSSFFPPSFRLWNELEPSVRNASSLSVFKVRGPFVEMFCIEKDSYIDAI